MPRFFFDVVNRIGFVEDPEGAELLDVHAAHSHAIDSIRSIVASEASMGVADLRGRVDVRSDDGSSFSVPFAEAVKVLTGDLPSGAAEGGGQE